MMLVMQHSINGAGGRQPDRTGRQTFVQIGVVRRLVPRVLVEHPPYAVIADGENDRRVGLQQHVLVQPIHVETGDAGLLFAAAG